MTTRILITFLGKGAPSIQDYEPVTYRFPDGDTYQDRRYFGFVLREHLNPDKTVILGTAGSMWNVLYQLDGRISDELLNQRNKLGQIIEGNATLPIEQEQTLVDTPHWNELLDFLTKHHPGCETGIIGYGQDQESQIRILQTVNRFVDEGAEVHLDITHGLRHLPMLAVLIALYLKRIKRVTIGGIYYGASELWRSNSDDSAPVLEMKGLLRIADWVSALDRFDKDGDYGEFSGLLREDGVKETTISHLERAAYDERNLNIGKARRELKSAYPELENLLGLSGLFRVPLEEHVSWHQIEDENPYARQCNRAELHFENGDYLRAAISAFEAYISKHMESDFFKRGPRDKTYVSLKKAAKNGPGDREFLKLMELRNVLAHSSFETVEDEIRTEVLRWVEDKTILKQELGRLMQRLLN